MLKEQDLNKTITSKILDLLKRKPKGIDFEEFIADNKFFNKY